jgi:Protein of unknown function (DUF2971)
MIRMPLTPQQFATIWQNFNVLNKRLDLITARRHGLLAHYTSVGTAETILRMNEVWFSNPLYMNDLQEMRAGISLALQYFPDAAQKAASTPQRADLLIHAFSHYFAHFDSETALDTYVFCLCTHQPGDTNGLLSMWREYGARGNGAALVLNIEKVNFIPQSPLLIAPVVYANDKEREQQLIAHLDAWADLTLNLNLADDQLFVASFAAFIFSKIVALTTKHHGFEEEQEVRVLYIPDNDPRGYLKSCLNYHVGPRGIEPKLKYRFGETYTPSSDPKPDENFKSGALTDLLEFILLGPTISTLLAKKSFVRMLELNNLNAFADRVYTSSIPLRPAF